MRQSTISALSDACSLLMHTLHIKLIKLHKTKVELKQGESVDNGQVKGNNSLLLARCCGKAFGLFSSPLLVKTLRRIL